MYLADLAELHIYGGNYTEAESYLQEMVEEPKFPALQQQGYDKLAELYTYVGRYRQALSALDSFIELAWEAGDTARAAIRTLYKAHLYRIGWQDIEKSRRAAEDVWKYRQSIQNPYYCGNLVLHLAGLGEYAQAESLVTRRFESGSPTAASFLTVLAGLRNQCEEAASQADAVRGKAVAFIQIYTLGGLADCQIRAGQYDRAIENLQQVQALGISPFSSTVAMYYPGSHYLLGWAYEGMGAADSARASYDRFLQLWRDADDDLIPLRDARMRYERLQSASAS